MMSGFDFKKPIPIEGIGFSWRPYRGEDFLLDGRFSIDQWHKIIYDIDNIVQWKYFLCKCRKVCTCYALYPTDKEEPIAMCYLLAEDGLYDEYKLGEVVSVHGGGWETDMYSRYLYARSWIKIVQYLYSLGCKVLTNVKQDNLSAKHLVEGTGFRLNEMELYEYFPEYDKYLKSPALSG